MTESEAHAFELLSPDMIIDAVESCGYISDGRLLALNSYENRVYQVGIEGAEPFIAKFYRPQRWTIEQIDEEHQFCFQLQGPLPPQLLRTSDQVHYTYLKVQLS